MLNWSGFDAMEMGLDINEDLSQTTNLVNADPERAAQMRAEYKEILNSRATRPMP